MVTNGRQNLLLQAAACLDTAQQELELVELTLDTQLAIYAAGPEFTPHPYVNDVLVRAHPVPPGAKYQVLEFRSQAGAQVPVMSRPTASLVHVLRGSILIRRHDQAGVLETYETGESAKFKAGEKHGCLVLTETQTLIIISH